MKKDRRFTTDELLYCLADITESDMIEETIRKLNPKIFIRTLTKEQALSLTAEEHLLRKYFLQKSYRYRVLKNKINKDATETTSGFLTERKEQENNNG